MTALRSPKTIGPNADGSAALSDPSVTGKVRLTVRDFSRDPSADLDTRTEATKTPHAIYPAMTLLVSAALLGATFTAIAMLHASTPTAHAPTALLVLPIMAAAMLFGRRVGLATLFAALLGARLLFFAGGNHLAFDSADDLISFVSLTAAAAGSTVVALHAHKAGRAIETTEARCHTFNRDVLFAVTSGRLVLCDADELVSMTVGRSVLQSEVSAPSDLHDLRCRLKASMSGCLGEEKIGDLLTCVTEAATNALKYAGTAALDATIADDVVSVAISDHGAGIDPSLLARATLESGFSTKNTLGMGFTLMLAMADRIALHTSDRGTQVVIQIRRA